MSIEFVAGKPGAGKSLFAMGLLERELVRSSRVVVTNLPVRLGAFNEYLQNKYPDLNPELARRLVILDEAGLATFYLRRHAGSELLPLLLDEKQRPFQPDFSCKREDDCGVMYILDELHLAFNSRAWMNTGPAALYYLSQHRKLGDDVICITQSTANVDKQFRSVAQEFHVVRNLSKERWGMFVGPSKFVVKSYLQQPTSKTDLPEYTRNFTLSPKLAECYDTAAGVGVVGKSADKEVTRKGLSVRWLYAGVAAIALGLVCIPVFAPDILGGVIGGLFKKKDSEPKSSQVGTTVPGAATRVVNAVPPGQPVNTAAPPSSVGPPLPAPLYVRNVVRTGKRYIVTLSDGTRIDETSGRVWSIGSTHVEMIDGKRLPIGRL